MTSECVFLRGVYSTITHALSLTHSKVQSRTESLKSPSETSSGAVAGVSISKTESLELGNFIGIGLLLIVGVLGHGSPAGKTNAKLHNRIIETKGHRHLVVVCSISSLMRLKKRRERNVCLVNINNTLAIFNYNYCSIFF